MSPAAVPHWVADLMPPPPDPRPPRELVAFAVLCLVLTVGGGAALGFDLGDAAGAGAAAFTGGLGSLACLAWLIGGRRRRQAQVRRMHALADLLGHGDHAVLAGVPPRLREALTRQLMWQLPAGGGVVALRADGEGQGPAWIDGAPGSPFVLDPAGLAPTTVAALASRAHMVLADPIADSVPGLARVVGANTVWVAAERPDGWPADRLLLCCRTDLRVQVLLQNALAQGASVLLLAAIPVVLASQLLGSTVDQVLAAGGVTDESAVAAWLAGSGYALSLIVIVGMVGLWARRPRLNASARRELHALMELALAGRPLAHPDLQPPPEPPMGRLRQWLHRRLRSSKIINPAMFMTAVTIAFVLMMLSQAVAAASLADSIVVFVQSGPGGTLTPRLGQLVFLVAADSILVLVGGSALARVIMRAIPVPIGRLESQDLRRWVSSMLLLAPLVLASGFSGWAVLALHALGTVRFETGFFVVMGLGVAGPALFSGALASLLITERYRNTEAYLRGPTALFLRRFQGFADRALLRAIQGTMPRRTRMVFLAGPASGAGTWELMNVCFAGFRWTAPLRSVPLYLEAHDDEWQACVTGLIELSDVIIIDTSVTGDAMRFEFEEVARLAAPERVIWTRQQPRRGYLDPAPTVDIGASVVRKLPYRPSWWQAMPKIVVGSISVLVAWIAVVAAGGAIGSLLASVIQLHLTMFSTETAARAAWVSLFIESFGRVFSGMVGFGGVLYVLGVLLRPSVTLADTVELRVNIRAAMKQRNTESPHILARLSALRGSAGLEGLVERWFARTAIVLGVFMVAAMGGLHLWETRAVAQDRGPARLAAAVALSAEDPVGAWMLVQPVPGIPDVPGWPALADLVSDVARPTLVLDQVLQTHWTGDADDLVVLRASGEVQRWPVEGTARPERFMEDLLRGSGIARRIGAPYFGAHSLALAAAADTAVLGLGRPGDSRIIEVDATPSRWQVVDERRRVGARMSSDGKTWAVLLDDGDVEVSVDGKLSTLDAGESVRRLVLGPDGRTLITEDERGSVLAWNLDVGAARRIAEGGARVAWSDDARRVLVVDAEGKAEVWALDRSFAALGSLLDTVGDAWLSPDGNQGAVLSTEGNLSLWALEPKPKRLAELGVAVTAAWSGSGHRLAVAREGGLLELWEGDQPARVAVGPATARRLWVDHMGTTVAIADAAGAVWLWSTGQTELTRLATAAPVSAVSFDVAGRWAATLDQAGELRIWSTTVRGAAQVASAWRPDASASVERVLADVDGTVVQSLALPEGREVVRTDHGAVVLVSGADQRVLPVLGAQVVRMAPDGSVLSSVDGKGFDTRVGLGPVDLAVLPTGTVGQLAVSGQLLVWRDPDLVVLDAAPPHNEHTRLPARPLHHRRGLSGLRTWRTRPSVSHLPRLSAAVVTAGQATLPRLVTGDPTGRHVAAAWDDQHVGVWDLDDPGPPTTWPVPGVPWSMAWLDDEHIAVELAPWVPLDRAEAVRTGQSLLVGARPSVLRRVVLKRTAGIVAEPAAQPPVQDNPTAAPMPDSGCAPLTSLVDAGTSPRRAAAERRACMAARRG